jgi:hypothetical protein
VSKLGAREMVPSLQIFPLLDGYRGSPRCDLRAIEDGLVRVGAMVEAHAEIAELDCNRLIASPDGAGRRRRKGPARSRAGRRADALPARVAPRLKGRPTLAGSAGKYVNGRALPP